LISQISSQSEHREIVTKAADRTASRLEELDTKLSRADNNNARTLASLEKMQETLAGIATSAWIEQSLENTGISKKEDLTGITRTLHHISTQLHNLSGDGNASSITLADLMAQLSELSARLAGVEVEVQSAATAAVVVEEISTIKSARSLEHQADMAAGERMREAVLGLDEFVRGQLDQVNVVCLIPSNLLSACPICLIRYFLYFVLIRISTGTGTG
jgi:chromosome segregation ATPase